MRHKECGGEIYEDWESEPYEYEGCVVPVQRCRKCGAEIISDCEVESLTQYA